MFLYTEAMNETLFQSEAWGRFRGGSHLIEVPGGRMLVIKQRLPFGLCWLSVARGPVLEEGCDPWKVWDKLWEKLKILASKERSVFVRVEPPLECGIDLEARGFRLAHAHHQPEWSLRLDLTQTEESLLAQMKPKGRYNIKVAEKAGVTVRMTHAKKDVAAFYEVLRKTGERDGFSIHPLNYYEEFVAHGHADGWATLFVAEHEGRVIGGVLATFYGDTATYYYGASDHASRATMAPYLTQWAAIREGKKRGHRWYDFLGVAPPDQPTHEWAGITQFKEKFGGERIHYPAAREYVFKGFWYGALLARKKLSSLLSRGRDQ